MIKSAGRRRRGKAMRSPSYESDPELEQECESDPELEQEQASCESGPKVEEARVEPPSMHSQVEVKVDSPINSNADSPQRIIYRAALEGDWKAAQTVLGSDRSVGFSPITERGDRPLHIAAAAKQTAFVKELLNKLDEDHVALMNNFGDTAFCYAALSGVVEIAEAMYEKNKSLPTITGTDDMTPIEMAALIRRTEMVEYLLKITNLTQFKAKARMNILIASIKANMYDIALNILNKDGSIVTSPEVDTRSALHALAQKSLSRYGTSQEWNQWICKRLVRIVPCVPCFKRIYDSIHDMRGQAIRFVEEFCARILTLEDTQIINLFRETTILNDAAKIGNVEFLRLVIRSYPDLLWEVDKNNYSIFHVAVIHRQERVFRLIYSIGAIKDLLMLYKDEDEGNNILHLAAKLPPPGRLNSVSGAALQMQRELIWFKEVKKVVRPSDVHMKNGKGITPRELFTKEHDKLREAGEDWMKDTATSCMVVATLIATVAFAAAFTLPGGNKEETGAPIFLNDWWFTVFVMSDAVAMFSSTASILMFLSILTSRYREEDFLFTLPAKLMIGLITLFASVVCMVLTFSATFFLVYKEENQGTKPKIVAGLALLPITLYAMLNCRLWISLIHSTIWASRFMFQPGKHRLFDNKIRS